MKKIFICLGLAVLATPAFGKTPQYILPEAPKPVAPPRENDFIQEKMKRLRKKK